MLSDTERELRWMEIQRRSLEAQERLRLHMEELKAGRPAEMKPVTPEMEERLRRIFKDRPMD